VAGRILRRSTTFRQSVQRLGVPSGSPAYRATSATLRALAPGPLSGGGDFEIPFSPGRACVRRVAGHNLWVLYRFDDEHVFPPDRTQPAPSSGRRARSFHGNLNVGPRALRVPHGQCATLPIGQSRQPTRSKQGAGEHSSVRSVSITFRVEREGRVQ
jgi:hypothetical protein